MAGFARGFIGKSQTSRDITTVFRSVSCLRGGDRKLHKSNADSVMSNGHDMHSVDSSVCVQVAVSSRSVLVKWRSTRERNM
ncbi:hypothetical protein ANN_17126 [Periplaneta americana]|uniref:Uncharacterized protein n=1 Tax=Periplaneta americana TaxID=6978 RepID=A0ABQ8SS22_PERAM|nr:hypothetical protein ANN_17126 [Periplaneta americana]